MEQRMADLEQAIRWTRDVLGRGFEIACEVQRAENCLGVSEIMSRQGEHLMGRLFGNRDLGTRDVFVCRPCLTKVRCLYGEENIRSVPGKEYFDRELLHLENGLYHLKQRPEQSLEKVAEPNKTTAKRKGRAKKNEGADVIRIAKPKKNGKGEKEETPRIHRPGGQVATKEDMRGYFQNPASPSSAASH